MGLSTALQGRGARRALQPDRIVGEGLTGDVEVAFAESGALWLRVPGGLLASDRITEIPASELQIRQEGNQLQISGGPLDVLEATVDPISTTSRALSQLAAGREPTWALGEGWSELGTATVTIERLGDDPTAAPRGQRHGKPRSTTSIWRSDEGAVRIDDPHGVFELPADRVLALERTGPRAWTVWAPTPTGGGWMRGVRLAFDAEPELEPSSEVPSALLPGRWIGRLDGRLMEAVMAARLGEGLVLLGADGAVNGRLEPGQFGWSWAGQLLIHGPSVSALAQISEARAGWLMGEIAPDPAVIEIRSAPLLAPGAGSARVDGEALILRTSNGALTGLAEIAPEEVKLRVRGRVAELEVGARASLRGPVASILGLRESILLACGRGPLERASTAALYRTWHRLRTERWLWLLYGPIFLTDRLLEVAGELPAEEGEDEVERARRRVIAETILVAQQSRAVRLRLGATPAALPYALLDEEAVWLDELTGGRGGGAMDAIRPRILGAFRNHVRGTCGYLGFALGDVERSVARLEPVHYPELRGGGDKTGVWGRVGLGAAMLMLSPISGAMTIASAVVGNVTSNVSKDATSQVLVDRFGPQCRSSWGLLVDVACVAAVETRNHLLPLWAAMAKRDRALWDALESEEPDRLRRSVISRIQALRAARAVPLEGLNGETVGELTDRMVERLRSGPQELVSRLTGRGLVPIDADG